MRPKKANKATVLGICALTAACNSRSDEQTEGTTRQELIAGAPMTLEARLIEKAGGKWNLMCMGRFRKLGAADVAVYQSTVTFLEEGAPAALLSGQVTSATSTFSRTALGNVLTITHPSVDPAGSLTVRMVRGTVDPRRRHSCQVVVKQNGVPVMRSEARPPREVSAPSGVFADSGQALGDHRTMAVALGDLDRDGDLDAVQGNWNQGSRVWRNDGSGNFVNSGALATTLTTALALGDLDGDGDLDLFQGNYNLGNRVWRNNGSGTFSDSGQAFGSNQVTSVALGDLDGDGDLDALQGNEYYQGSRVWRNNGSGVFTDSGQVFGGSLYLNKVALGDLDGDGDLDAFIGNTSSSNRIFLNNGSGVFTDSGQSPATGYTRTVALGDLDGDGDLDAFCGNIQNQPNRVLLNNGSGIFTDTNQALGNDNTRAVALGDLDSDGDLDAFDGNYNQPNRVWLNNGAGTFSNSFQALGNHATQALALGDLDGDGDLDAWEGNYGNGYGVQPNRVWRNQ